MKHIICISAAIAVIALVAPSAARAQGDEIQVYDGGLAPVGVFNLTVHNNFTPNGVKVPAFPGAIISDKSLNGVPEWAYGVTNWFEAGLYLPLYSIDKDQGAVSTASSCARSSRCRTETIGGLCTAPTSSSAGTRNTGTPSG